MKMKYVVLLAVGALCLAGCNKPRDIPDSKLEDLFYDLYLTTAYASQHTLPDSTDLYGPVLRRHGYTKEDLYYTIGKIAGRKSSRMSDIVEAVERRLTADYDVMAARNAVRLKADTLVGERYRRRVLSRDRIEVRSLSDTSKLAFSLPVREGSYAIEYNYRVDTADKNPSLRFAGFLRDTAGRRAVTLTSVWLSRQPGRVSVSTPVDAVMDELEFRAALYPRNATRPNLRIDSLNVWYYLPQSVATDSLMIDLFPYKSTTPFVNERLRAQAKRPSYVLRLPAGAACDSIR